MSMYMSTIYVQPNTLILFITVTFITANIWKVVKCPSAIEPIHEL